MCFDGCWDYFYELKILLFFSQTKQFVESMQLFSPYCQLSCKMYMEHGSGEDIFTISVQFAFMDLPSCVLGFLRFTKFEQPDRHLSISQTCSKWKLIFSLHIWMRCCAFVHVTVETYRSRCIACVPPWSLAYCKVILVVKNGLCHSPPGQEGFNKDKQSCATCE